MDPVWHGSGNDAGMKLSDAPGFLVIGSLMSFLPALLPAYFPATGPDGTNTSALWLEVMGGVNNLVGIGLVARGLPAILSRLLDWRLPALPQRRPAVAVRVRPPARVLRPVFVHPAVRLEQGLRARYRRRVAA